MCRFIVCIVYIHRYTSFLTEAALTKAVLTKAESTKAAFVKDRIFIRPDHLESHGHRHYFCQIHKFIHYRFIEN